MTLVPEIVVLTMGGTIATVAGADGREPSLSAADQAGLLVDSTGVNVRVREVAATHSSAIGPDDVWRLAGIIGEEIAGRADGIVITHGTDTIEETAYALSLLLDRRVPIVLTAAMRGPDLPGSDARANLGAALIGARTPELAAFGPVVILQDEVHLATWVTKVHTSRVAAFASPAAGPIGYVTEDRVHFVSGHPIRPEQLPVTGPPVGRVELIWAVSGGDGLLIDRIADVADGIVIAATGGGHVSPVTADSLLRYAASGKPVVLASRCGNGPVLRETYGGPGAERRLLAGGLVSAGQLAPVKARLRLLFGISAGISARSLFEATE
jgi:L-asparaginase